MSKKIYEYDPETGEFRAESTATPDRARPGEYLQRLNSTFIKPPTVAKNEVCVWDGEKWQVKPDWRDTTYYVRNADGHIESVTIKQIGETAPAGGYKSIEGVPKTRAEKEAEVRAERNARIDTVDKDINKAEDNGNEALAASLRIYRQALRDVPAQPGFPDSVKWPVMS